MEKVKKYRHLILKLLKEYQAIESPFQPEVQNQIIADSKTDKYLLIRHGWDKKKYVHYIVFQLDILNGKIWIQENRTDADIAGELEEYGVSRKDIVGGILHSSLDPDSGSYVT